MRRRPRGVRAAWPSGPRSSATARVWYAEHHNMASIASSATGGAHRARRRAHRAPSASAPAGSCCPTTRRSTIAEQFGTLADLHPGRIDLGLGRAPGTDQPTMRALRRDPTAAESFPQDVLELQALPRRTSTRIPGVQRHARGGARTCRSTSSARRCSAPQLAAVARPAVRVRLALRARRAARGGRRSTGSEFQPSAQLERAVRDRRRQRDRGRHRGRGAASSCSIAQRRRVRRLFGRDGRPLVRRRRRPHPALAAGGPASTR